MKAAVYREYGGPDVLQLRDVARPVAGDGEVLVRVRASSVNSWEWDLVRGAPLVRLEGWRRPRHLILGADIAGKVESVGPSVTQFEPGDDVFGDISSAGWGGYAEFVSVRADVLAPKPPNLTYEEAAAVPQAGVLALQGLRDRGRVRTGHRVLVNGAGGGAGTFAVQIAKSFGAEVTGVDRAPKLDALRTIGADDVIDFMATDYTRIGKRYDMILDVVADRSVFAYRRALAPDGRFVAVGGSIPAMIGIGGLGGLMSLAGEKKTGLLFHRPRAIDLVALTELIEGGEVVPVIDRSYPLSEVADAFRYFAQGGVIGKVVITI
jgi:NADPH:quinone reductase-like Zn-dependent oxidoreductase